PLKKNQGISQLNIRTKTNTMRKVLALYCLLLFQAMPLGAQETETYYLKDEDFRLSPHDSLLIAEMNKKDTIPVWEFGIAGGHVFSIGNVDYLPGVGVGVHFRRALDYIFSVRSDIFYARIRGEDEGNAREFRNDWFSASLLGVMTLNNLKWEDKTRKVNLYALGGIGVNYFETKVRENDLPTRTITGKMAWHGTFGGGISFRIGRRFNVGFEHKVISGFGQRGDLVDGFETITANTHRRTFADIIHYSNVHVNFNISRSAEEEEPKYWLNPLFDVYQELDSIKQVLKQLNDSDGDGVVDLIDREPESPAGAYVDTKGVTRDGDLDGIPDFRDRQPYSPPGVPIDAYGVAKEETETERANVRAIVQEEIAKIEFPQPPPPVIETKTSNWYLPNVYFDAGSIELKPIDHATLLKVAEVMLENPDEKFVVEGNTDLAGSEKANNRLSYKRALAVVNKLVSLGVPREQLLLRWNGEHKTLVEGLHEVNRRVEIRRAKEGETEMPPPE
ncbi:MAG: OmpA family protein, partial [Bacteroidetes bacterium]